MEIKSQIQSQLLLNVTFDPQFLPTKYKADHKPVAANLAWQRLVQFSSNLHIFQTQNRLSTFENSLKCFP